MNRFTKVKDIAKQAGLFDADSGSRTESQSQPKTLSKPEVPQTLSKRKQRRVEAFVEIHDAREDKRQELGYGSRPFLLCNLPIKRPKAGERVWERRNGRFFLKIVAGEGSELPYGQDRLIPILVASLAQRQQSREVDLGTTADMCRLLGLPTNSGRSYTRIAEAFDRVFKADIYWGTEDERQGGTWTDETRMHFFDRRQLWRQRAADESANGGYRNKVILSESFWRELQEHPIPIDLNVVQALADAPGNLDFYLWLCLRCFTIPPGKTVHIPLFGQEGLSTQFGSVEYSRQRRFRQKIAEWLQTIKGSWPGCICDLEGDMLVIRHCRAINSAESNVPQ